MLIRYIFRYLAGVVTVACSGRGKNALLSELLKRGREVFSVRRKNDEVHFSAVARDYREIARLARRCGCKTRITRKRGAPFYFLGVKHKAALGCGVASFILTMLLLGETVMTINITGNSTVSKGRIDAALLEHGLRVGMLQESVNIDYLKQNLLLDIKELSWMTVNLSFGTAEIMLWDKTVVAEKEERSNEAIVALRDAQIKSVDVESGAAAVSPGEVVTKGQVLVTAAPYYIEGSWTKTVKADVIAYTVYNTELFIPREYTVREKTGRTYKTSELRIFDVRLPLGIKKNPFFDFELMQYETPCSLFGIVLPAGKAVCEYEEVETKSYLLDENSARIYLNEMQREYEEETLIGKRILNRSGTLAEEESGFRLTLEYLCEENIGKSIQIE